MGNKKDIGKAIKEKINYLDKSPNDNGWNAIQNELDEKKKKRIIIPFWFNYVALVTIGVLTYWLLIDNSFSEIHFFKLDKNENNSKEIQLQEKSSIESNENIFKSDSLLDTRDKNEIVKKSDSKSTINSIILKNTKLVQYQLNNKNLFKTSKTNTTHFKKHISNSLKSKNHNSKKTLITYKKENEENINIQDLVTKPEKITNNNKTLENSILTLSDSSKSKKVKRKESETVKKDSIIKNDNKKDALTVSIFGSPTISGFSKNSSVLDSRLDSNAKTSEITFSYGAYLCYKGNENLSFRIGFSKNALRFITEKAVINVFDYANITYLSGFSNSYIYNQSNSSEYMNIIQNISYNEIPLEIKYKFINHKIGFNAIVGINYLMLDKNEISIQTSNGTNFRIGKTKDLLKSTIGLNIGLGIDYKISKRIKFNMEPLLKYHLKDYQNSIKTNPYSFNILTGLEIKFSK